MSNTEQEDVWVDAWSDLNFLMDKHKTINLFLPEYQETTLENAQQWIQDVAYSGDKITLKVEVYEGKEAILIDREKA